MDRIKIGIIGGGAAGMMAAIYAADEGADVTLIERNTACGRKLRITGKGRCNVTNDCTRDEFLRNVPTNPRFLYSALHFLSVEDTKYFFESEGVPLKTERGNRVFPVSDKASDIVSCLVSAAKKRGVGIIEGRAEGLDISEGAVRGIYVSGRVLPFDRVIIATGGMSYPRTGSDGDGYRLAREAGHSVTDLTPSLVPIVSRSRICGRMQGLSLKNVALRITDRQSSRCVYEDFGEMMFTHFGVTGPMVLSASAHLSDISRGRYEAHIDLKPALDERTLDGRILSDFSKYQNKDFVNALGDLLPQKLIPVIIELSGIPERKKINSVTKEERARLVSLIKALPLSLDGFRPIDEAIVTKGGVTVCEIDPRTMCSKIVGGLYFAGEVIDVDAYTGGFNLQIAFCTGALAGHSAAQL